MTKEISEFKISDYCLVIDILGTTNRMANPNTYPESLLDLLNVVTIAYQQSTNVSSPSQSVPFFQFGDSVVFASNNTDELVSLGSNIFVSAIRKEILLQGCICGRGIFHIKNLNDLKGVGKVHSSMSSMLLFGLGLVGAFAAMKGILGPRILINEDFGGIQKGLNWNKYINTSSFLSSDTTTSYSISEVRWWEKIQDIDDLIGSFLDKTKKEYKHRKNWIESNGTNQDRRELKGYKLRIKHLETFKNMLANDPS